MTHANENIGIGLWQAQTCGGVECIQTDKDQAYLTDKDSISGTLHMCK